MIIQEYARPSSVEEAYALLSRSSDNAVIGGLTAIKLVGRDIGVAIDLSDLGFDYIKEDGGSLRIGATSSLRSVELSGPLRSRLLGHARGRPSPASAECSCGTTLRSAARVLSTWPISDTVAALLAIDAELAFYRAGRLSPGIIPGAPRPSRYSDRDSYPGHRPALRPGSDSDIVPGFPPSHGRRRRAGARGENRRRREAGPGRVGERGHASVLFRARELGKRATSRAKSSTSATT